MKTLCGTASLLALSLIAVTWPQPTLAADADAMKRGPQTHSIVAFDPPGSIETIPSSINSAGTIAGYYLDAQLVAHGFIRDSSGNYTTVDAPNAATGAYIGTFIWGINDSGQAVGFYNPLSAPTTYQGFLFGSAGDFTIINFPGAAYTMPVALNAAGEVAGCAGPTACAGDGDVGFVWETSSITQFLPSGAVKPWSVAVNRSGSTTGWYFDSKNVEYGFLRTAAGKIAEFAVPGSYIGPGLGTRPAGISDNGLIAGSYEDTSLNSHGFIRDQAGTFTSFDAPGVGTTETTVTGISSTGATTGFCYSDLPIRAFVRSPLGKIAAFGVPLATQTYGVAINASEQVTGSYIDSSYVTHGFLRN